MKKVLKFIRNFIIGVFLILYFTFIILISTLLLNKNKYGVTQFGDKVLILVDNKVSNENYPEGTLAIVQEKEFDEYKVGDEVFVYESTAKKTVKIVIANIEKIVTDASTPYVVLSDNGGAWGAEFLAGSIYSTYPSLGKFLSIIESKWIFFGTLIVPCFLILIYEIYMIIIYLKFGDEDEEQQVKVKKKTKDNDEKTIQTDETDEKIDMLMAEVERLRNERLEAKEEKEELEEKTEIEDKVEESEKVIEEELTQEKKKQDEEDETLRTLSSIKIFKDSENSELEKVRNKFNFEKPHEIEEENKLEEATENKEVSENVQSEEKTEDLENVEEEANLEVETENKEVVDEIKEETKDLSDSEKIDMLMAQLAELKAKQAQEADIKEEKKDESKVVPENKTEDFARDIETKYEMYHNLYENDSQNPEIDFYGENSSSDLNNLFKNMFNDENDDNK